MLVRRRCETVDKRGNEPVDEPVNKTVNPDEDDSAPEVFLLVVQ
jgi:hypothetical protein